MASHKIEDVEGIGPGVGEKLRAAGIKNTDSLLDSCCTPKQRKELAQKTDLPEGQILKLANMVDLYRIKGVGAEFAELLEAAGVDTVPELARRNAANLTRAMADVNERKKLTRRTPSESETAKWIEEAKTLPRLLEH